MTNVMKVLFQYAEEHMVHSLMIQTPDYLQIRSNAIKQEEAFLALLTKETAERYEKMMAECHRRDYIYEQALFRAGFLIALELIR